jgi:CRP-like cAMP-binding protein
VDRPTLPPALLQILETIPRILRIVDSGVKWQQLLAGEELVREGEPSDGCLYVLLNGRVRLSMSGGNAQSVLANQGRGTLIGTLDTDLLHWNDLADGLSSLR